MLLCGESYEKFTIEVVNVIHRWRWGTMTSLYAPKYKLFPNTRLTITFENTIVKQFLKRPALPVKVTLNRNYPS
jgi:hypothetical protein